MFNLNNLNEISSGFCNCRVGIGCDCRDAIVTVAVKVILAVEGAVAGKVSIYGVEVFIGRVGLDKQENRNREMRLNKNKIGFIGAFF